MSSNLLEGCRGWKTALFYNQSSRYYRPFESASAWHPERLRHKSCPVSSGSLPIPVLASPRCHLGRRAQWRLFELLDALQREKHWLRAVWELAGWPSRNEPVWAVGPTVKWSVRRHLQAVFGMKKSSGLRRP